MYIEQRRERIMFVKSQTDKLEKIVSWLEQNNNIKHLSKYKRQQRLADEVKASIRLNRGTFYN